jgi:hypothetical protein
VKDSGELDILTKGWRGVGRRINVVRGAYKYGRARAIIVSSFSPYW